MLGREFPRKDHRRLCLRHLGLAPSPALLRSRRPGGEAVLLLYGRARIPRWLGAASNPWIPRRALQTERRHDCRVSGSEYNQARRNSLSRYTQTRTWVLSRGPIGRHAVSQLL